jgi:hypothetical protein
VLFLGRHLRVDPVIVSSAPNDSRERALLLNITELADAAKQLQASAISFILTLGQHWIDRSSGSGDLRFLNAACKLLGAVWTRYSTAGRPVPGSGPWHDLTGPLATVAHQLGAASDNLAARLRDRLPVPAMAAPAPRSPLDLGIAPVPAGPVAGTVAVLAGAGSAGAQRFLHAAHIAGIPVTAVCWFGKASNDAQPVRSGYADAWYPRLS